ncbi:hypothetical protein GJAV_G00005520 [Gymnothorax javanicus]|nr:hypothetical protein GJAV_G00005520 [Gymnothorax javanicus]
MRAANLTAQPTVSTPRPTDALPHTDPSEDLNYSHEEKSVLMVIQEAQPPQATNLMPTSENIGTTGAPTKESNPEELIQSWNRRTVFECFIFSFLEMSGKLVIVTILALQVSVTFCELPQPDQELVEKYTQFKVYFGQWLYSFAIKTSDIMEYVYETYEKILNTKPVKDFFEELKQNPHVQRFKEVTRSMLQRDVSDAIFSLLEKAQTDVLGLYGEHVRPWAGPYLEQAITAFKDCLYSVAPVEFP